MSWQGPRTIRSGMLADDTRHLCRPGVRCQDPLPSVLSTGRESSVDDETILIYGDSRSYALRHEVPLPFPDPVAYLEVGGRRWVLAGLLDVPRLTALGASTGFEVVPFEELGLRESLGGGKSLAEAIVDTLVAACARFSVS